MNPRVDLDPTKLKQPGKAVDTFGPKAEAMRQALQAAGKPLAASELIVRAKAITRDNYGLAAWKQAINRHDHRLAEYGIEKLKDGTKESVFKLNNDPF